MVRRDDADGPDVGQDASWTFVPDIDTDGDGTLDAVSFGVGVTGVTAQVAP